MISYGIFTFMTRLNNGGNLWMTLQTQFNHIQLMIHTYVSVRRMDKVTTLKYRY